MFYSEKNFLVQGHTLGVQQKIYYLYDKVHKRIGYNFQNFNFSFTRRRIDSLDNFTAKPFQIAHTEYRFCDYVFLNHYNQLKENDLTSKKLVINNFLKRMSVRDKRYLRQTISTVNRTITVNQLNMSCTFYLEIFKLRFIFEQRIYC